MRQLHIILLVAIAVIGGILLFILFHFVINDFFSYPKYEYIPIDYLEYNAMFVIADSKKPKNSIHAEYGRFSEDLVGYIVFPENAKRNFSDSLLVKNNNGLVFEISFWQIGNDGIQLSDTRKGVDNIQGLVPTSKKCLNWPTVCFDTQNTVVYAITSISPEIEIDYYELEKSNQRVKDIMVGVNGTVFILLDMNYLMPPEEYEHHVVASQTTFIPVTTKDPQSCFWDSEPRLCKIEQKLLEIEKDE